MDFQGENAASVFWDKTGAWPNHAYAVLGVMKDARHDHIVHVAIRMDFPTKPREGYARDPWKVPGEPTGVTTAKFS